MFLAFFAEIFVQIATFVTAFLAAFIVASPLLMILLLGEAERRWTLATARRERFDESGYSVDELDAWDEWKRVEQIERARFRSMFTWSDLGEAVGDPREVDPASTATALAELLSQAKIRFEDKPEALRIYAESLQAFLPRRPANDESERPTLPASTATTAITVVGSRE